MSGVFTEEQEELRRYARQWLDENAPLEAVRKIAETPEGFDAAQWSELGSLGWLGIAVGEAYGGSGFGFMELAVLAEEMGRTLYPSPFLSTVVLGTWLVERLGTDDQKAEILPAVVRGDHRLAVAAGRAAVHDLVARRQGTDWVVSGRARLVLDGHTAHTLIVEAAADDGTRLFLVDGDAGGLERNPLSVMDLTRPQAEVTATDVVASPLGDGRAGDAVDHALDRAVAALAMEQVGGAQACLDMSVEYAKVRHQFGRPIGSFQAIKHMCADMLVGVESARSAAYHLASVIDHDPEEAAIAAPVAKSFCSEAYEKAAGDTIQIHGGIGFTWEHDAHLYLKRAKSSALLFGDPRYHRAVLASRLGIE